MFEPERCPTTTTDRARQSYDAPQQQTAPASRTSRGTRGRCPTRASAASPTVYASSQRDGSRRSPAQKTPTRRGIPPSSRWLTILRHCTPICTCQIRKVVAARGGCRIRKLPYKERGNLGYFSPEVTVEIDAVILGRGAADLGAISALSLIHI